MITSTKDFLKMDLDELFDHLVTFVISDKKAPEVIEELMMSARYSEKADFKVMVDYAQILSETAMSFEVGDKFAQRVIQFIDIIDRATKLEIWMVAANAWNNLAVTYQSKMMLERALECYSHALRIESQHKNYKISPLVYTNIIGIFVRMKELDKAMKCVETAEEILEKNKDTIPRYLMRYVSICLWHMRIRIEKKEIDKDVLKIYYDRIMAVDPEELSFEIKGFVLTAKYHYGFFFFEKEEYEKILDQVKEVLGIQHYALYLQQSIELSKIHGKEYDTYVQRLLELEEYEDSFHPMINFYTFEVLMEYYEKEGNLKKLEETKVKYINIANGYLDQLSEQQNQAVNTIEQLLMSEEFKKNNDIENVEFKKIADEAIKTKKELEQAYKRIEIIGELGRKITATTDLKELVDMIYHIVKEHLSVDFFALFYTDEDNKMLQSVAVYQKGEAQSKIEIDLKNKHNVFVQCYDNRCFLQSDKSSSVLIPLIVAGRVIGVLCLQSGQEGAYEGENLSFLKEIEPYLSIALNNGIKSWMMEKERENRRKIQLELEEANAILAKISSMDGLTQISSRRDFEEKFKQMLHLAKEEGKSVCTFMMDIDYFKLYNDNYGHLQGDEILKQVAKVFKEHLNSVDGLSARFGGEEFIGAALNLNEGEALQLAKNICKEIQSLNIEHRVSPWNVVTASIGVAVAKYPDESMRSKLMTMADECLYLAKDTGKNKCAISVEKGRRGIAQSDFTKL